jgi:tetratricopeptide (TPR) repeat protein
VSSGALWRGVTHEGIHNVTTTATFQKLKFSEVVKSPDEMFEKFARDERMLQGEVARDPSNTRSWYYLGVSLHGLGDLEGAIEAFRKCARLRGWSEEGAWACFKAAGLLVYLKRYDDAIEVAGAGLIRDPGMGELCTIAAMASLKKGDTESAQCWSDMARVHSGKESRALGRRLGFRDPKMLAAGAAGCWERWTTPPAQEAPVVEGAEKA